MNEGKEMRHHKVDGTAGASRIGTHNIMPPGDTRIAESFPYEGHMIVHNAWHKNNVLHSARHHGFNVTDASAIDMAMTTVGHSDVHYEIWWRDKHVNVQVLGPKSNGIGLQKISYESMFPPVTHDSRNIVPTHVGPGMEQQKTGNDYLNDGLRPENSIVELPFRPMWDGWQGPHVPGWDTGQLLLTPQEVQCRIFAGSNRSTLQEEINSWLSEKSKNLGFHIMDVKFDVALEGKGDGIWYSAIYTYRG